MKKMYNILLKVSNKLEKYLKWTESESKRPPITMSVTIALLALIIIQCIIGKQVVSVKQIIVIQVVAGLIDASIVGMFEVVGRIMHILDDKINQALDCGENE